MKEAREDIHADEPVDVDCIALFDDVDLAVAELEGADFDVVCEGGVGRFAAFAADTADIHMAKLLQTCALGYGTADDETAGSGVDLQASVVVVELYVEAEGADVSGVSHHGRECDGGGFVVGDETAGFVRFDELALQVIEIEVEASCCLGIVATTSGEISFKLGDAFFDREGFEPASTDSRIVGIERVGGGDPLCGGGVLRVEAEEPVP